MRLKSHFIQECGDQLSGWFDAFPTAGDAGNPGQAFEGGERNRQVLLNKAINLSQDIGHGTTSL
jgi:hypothetical protein